VKAQCERCKEIVELRFRSSERGMDVTCPACAGSYFVPATLVANLTVPAAVSGPGAEEIACPKCAHIQPDDRDSCRRCGLAVARFPAYEGAIDEDVPVAVADCWRACRERWHDPEAHEALLVAVALADRYAYAATRYRAVLREEPGDAIAGRRLQEVMRRAEAGLLRTAAIRHAAEDKEPFRNVAVMLVLLVVLVGFGLVYAVFLRGGAGGEDPGGPGRSQVRPRRASPGAPAPAPTPASRAGEKGGR
jgi:hypothetical protein